MQAVFKSELDKIDLEKIKNFCNSVEYISLEQSLGFPEVLYKSKINYFYLLDNGIIKSFSQILENFKFAHIWFGPVCCDRELMIASIEEIINFYKKKGFWYLGIQMYYKSGYDADYIEYNLNKNNNITYVFNNDNTKSSLEINLENSIEEITSNIRKGHKSDIKKALKSGLKVEAIKDEADLHLFTEIYLKMCRVRKIGGHSAIEIFRICDYLIKNNKGQIMVAKDSNDTIIGGAIMAYQGISVRYLLGASDPDRRDLPLLHLVIFEAIKNAKSGAFRYFDFWGYNHFADENDQANNINHFKKGFGGYYIFFAKKMNINLVAKGYKINKLAAHLRTLKVNIWKLLHRK